MSTISSIQTSAFVKALLSFEKLFLWYYALGNLFRYFFLIKDYIHVFTSKLVWDLNPTPKFSQIFQNLLYLYVHNHVITPACQQNVLVIINVWLKIKYFCKKKNLASHFLFVRFFSFSEVLSSKFSFPKL